MTDRELDEDFRPDGGVTVRPQSNATARREKVRKELDAWRDKALRRDATQKVMRTLDVWGLDAREMAQLLGLSPASRGTLARFRSGERVLSPVEDAWRRAMGILSIQRSLEVFAPENPEWRDDWVQQPIAGLGGERPIDIMLADGIGGIEQVGRCATSLGHH